MSIAYDDLIEAFPEFASPAVYPKKQVDFWLAEAYTTLNVARLGARADLAVMLFVAHNISLSAMAARSTRGGGIASVATGPISSKSVGGASVSYNSEAMTIKGAGAWNATLYGQRLYKMLQSLNAGGVYVPATSQPRFVPGGR